MARTTKTGLDYFPFDVDFFDDEKLQFTSARFGIKGEIVAVKLLCRIYRNGYFLQWGESECILFSKRAGEGINYQLVTDIIDELLERNFFDRRMFEQYRILTSRGIQIRYFEATKRRKNLDVNTMYALIPINDNINPINADINPLNADNSTQRKEKESKEKERMFPTINDCINFFKENNSTQSSAERFFNNYESTGWKKGGTIISDWKSLARNWIDGDKNKNNGHNNQLSSTLGQKDQGFKEVLKQAEDEIKKHGKFKGFDKVDSGTENKTNDDLPI